MTTKTVTIYFRRFRHRTTGAEISRPEALGSPGEEWDEIPNPAERQHLESSLATAFCAMQRSFDAAERQKQWLECLRLAKEIDRLNGVSVDKRMEDR